MDANNNPVRRIVLCLPHGIVYVLPNVCQQCYLISVSQINRRYAERIGDLDANPLIELEETEIGNGQYAPALFFRTIHVEDLFRNIPHERTRLGVPPGYTAWSQLWSDVAILHLQIPIQQLMTLGM